MQTSTVQHEEEQEELQGIFAEGIPVFSYRYVLGGETSQINIALCLSAELPL